MRKAILVSAFGLFLTTFACDEDKKPAEDKYPPIEEKDLKGVIRTSLDSPKPTDAQLARRKANTAKVAAMGLPTFADLPVVEDVAQVKPRSPQEVAKRCIATVICCAKGETKGKEEKLVTDLVEEYGAKDFFSPDEAKFIATKTPARQELVNFTWRYECVHVFLWALGIIDSLNPPNAICDVAHDVGVLRKTDPKDFVAKASLRPMSEVLDMADYYYRLHWAAIELRLKGKSSDEINEGIIKERHRALNWLIRYMNQAWDDVSTDT